MDAQQITQRICGVCPISHGLASIAAQEEAYGVRPPNNGRLARNLILGNQLHPISPRSLLPVIGPGFHRYHRHIKILGNRSFAERAQILGQIPTEFHCRLSRGALLAEI